VHFDGHVSQLGAYGTLAIGLRRSLIEAFVSAKITLTVPHTVRIDLVGALPTGVMARDVFHHLVRLFGPGACRFQVLELGGEGLSQFSTDGLQAIAGLAMFIGAQTAIVNPEDDMRYAKAVGVARKRFGRIVSDPDAVYSSRHVVDLSTLEPVVVVPPSPANTRSLQEYLGLKVDVGYIGSCVSGRLEDLRVAARVLSGRKVRPGFALYVVPTSQAVLADAAQEGLIKPLVEAGAYIGGSTCDYCYGRIGVMKAGQRAVSTGTLNVRGRMGDLDAEIFIGSAATVAASAIEGCLADPRPYLRGWST
jgi:3-isopropylmalate/(R)-2-methylmalate dehydratase large subunit